MTATSSTRRPSASACDQLSMNTPTTRTFEFITMTTSNPNCLHTHAIHIHRLLGSGGEDGDEVEEVSPAEWSAILEIRELKKEIKVSYLSTE